MVLISSGTFSGYQVTKPTLWHIIPPVVIAYLCNIVQHVSLSFYCNVLCLHSSESCFWTGFKLQWAGSLPTLEELKAANWTAFCFFECVCVGVFAACFDSPVLMDGAFRCEKVNRSPTVVSLCSLSLQIGVPVCPWVCVCKNIQYYIQGCFISVCSSPLSCTGFCVTACVYVFFCRVCSASVLKTEEPTWFQPPVGLMAFEEMKCLLSSTHAAALICCPLKIHTHTQT